MDGQSKGFASRIVKYQQNTNKSSKNGNSLYKAPGDLPIVHLKRNEILFKNRRSNSLTNLRVGRLEKMPLVNEYDLAAHFHPEPPRSFDDNTSCRRPQLVHLAEGPKPTHDAFRGPRSVLDELREISRKRINKFDSEPEVKDSKKYCPGGNDLDGVIAPSTTCNQKRQRDRNVSPPLGPTVVQQKTKKLCRDSHDVISSLSSSRSMARGPAVSKSSSVIMSGSKRITSEVDSTFLRPSKTGLESIADNKAKAPVVVSSSGESNTAQTLQRTVSVPVMRSITLFNKDYGALKRKGEPIEKEHHGGDDDDGEEDEEGEDSTGPGPFVNPQESSPTLAVRLDERRKVEKNKLALMLKCLAGDFEDSDEDEVATTKDVVDTAKRTNSESVPSVPVSNPVNNSAFPLPAAEAKPVEVKKPDFVDKQTTLPTEKLQLSTNESSTMKFPLLPTTTNSFIPPASNFTKDSETTSKVSVSVTRDLGTAPTGVVIQSAAPIMNTFNPPVKASPSPSPGFKFGADLPVLSGITPIAAVVATSTAAPSTMVTASAPVKSTIPGIFSFPKSPPATQINPAAPLGVSGPISVATSAPAQTSSSTFAPVANAAVEKTTAFNASSLFSFGATPSKDATPALLPTVTSVAASAPPPAGTSFTFGSSTIAPQKSVPQTGFSLAAAVSAQSQPPPISSAGSSFSFNAASMSGISAPATPQPTSSFSFGLGSGFEASTTTDNRKMSAPVFGAQPTSTVGAPITTSSSPFSVSTPATDLGKSATFTFGSTAAKTGLAASVPPTTTTSLSSAPTIFGAATTAPLSFGAVSQGTFAAPGTAPAKTQSLFGAPAPTTTSTGTGAFNFSATQSQTNGAFMFGDSATPKPANNPTPSPSFGSFNFGGAPGALPQVTQAQQPATKTFSFGQSAAAGPPTTGGFFNFGAQGGDQSGGAPAFNIGSGGGPPRRPIRQATRRMK